MRSKNALDPAVLRLTETPSHLDLKDRVAITLGDPAYLYELESVLSGTRKQMEKAIAAAISDGRAVRYGSPPRCLYASMREIPNGLNGLSSAAVRLLQRMPTAGGVLIGTLGDLLGSVGPQVDELVRAELAMRLPGRRDIVFLTPAGTDARATLGSGAATRRLRLNEIEIEASGWWFDLSTLASGKPTHSKRLVELGYARARGAKLVITPLGTRVWQERVDAWLTTRDLDERDMVTGRPVGEEEGEIEMGTRRAELAAAEERAERAEQDAAEARRELQMERDRASADREEREEREEAERRARIEKPRAYLLLRGDLPSLGAGKGRAQSMHAGNAMTWQTVVEPMMRGEDPDEDIMAWHHEGRGFGTAISLGGSDVTARVVQGVIDMARQCGRRGGEIIDDTYPYIIDDEIRPLIDPSLHTAPPRRIKGGWVCCRREVTGAWLFGTKDELDPLLARFGLTPDRID